ncbi:MAG TPA: HD domain-containing phosphohydrolase [Anaerovoracaceae bacterium]|nr:HD domain-containing phosphohydrolase [Anaerovoracaceae bacterium]
MTRKVGDVKLDIILIKDLFYNLAFLLTLILIYTVFQNKVNKGTLVYNILLGISIGTVGIIIMTASIQTSNGIFLDARSILISVTGLFFGVLPTLIAGVMIILYRIFIGGAGIYPAVLVIIAAGTIGSIWHRVRFEKLLSTKNTINLEFYFFGLLINIIMLLSMFVLPKAQALNVLQAIFLPIIILYPIGTYLICVLLKNQYIRNNMIQELKESKETVEHADRLVKLSKAIGKKLKLSDDNIFELELATTLHDIGKMSIDQQILMKPGKLTEEEWGEIKKHPEAGYRIAQAASELMPISEYILTHHERWDGKGYPQGLKAEEIPLIARIINVVDSYDAMTSKRTYGKELSKEEAITEMRSCAGSQFDPELIEIFIEEVLTEL